jgi:hypothetical protein
MVEPRGGLRVQLFNPQIGPSVPAMTTPQGYCRFQYMSMNVKAPYEIRVMWGNRIVYRQYLRHLGQQLPIILR